MKTFQFGAGRRMWIVGNWCLSFDPDNQFIGRHPNPSSVVYAFFGLTGEHFRPDTYSAEFERRQQAKAIRRWQKVRNRIWHQSMRAISRKPDDDYKTLLGRRKRYLRSRYELEAGDARALGEWVPTLDELQGQLHIEAESIR